MKTVEKNETKNLPDDNRNWIGFDFSHDGVIFGDDENGNKGSDDTDDMNYNGDERETTKEDVEERMKQNELTYYPAMRKRMRQTVSYPPDRYELSEVASNITGVNPCNISISYSDAISRSDKGKWQAAMIFDIDSLD